jgi:catechol 2,3-dioxygenase-like lactoylglutathione lyase family enzyme
VLQGLKLLEVSLYCDDLARAAAFYRTLLDLEQLHADDRLIAFDAGSATVLLLFRRGASAGGIPLPRGEIPPHDGSGPSHVAFSIAASELPALRERLRVAGVSVESELEWPRGGTSLYVRDPEGHSVEFATPGVWRTY